MDAKDLRTESSLGSRNHDGSNKFPQSATAIMCNRNKSYHDVGSNSLGKVEVPSSRPCAVIGPDRVVPPSAAADPFPKKPPPDQWMGADPSLYRRPPDYPMKMSNHQTQIRNISPRQTFQENMQRIMMPPTYNSIKMTKDSNLLGDGNLIPMPKSTKINVPTEAKYCDVPYNVSPLPMEQKNIREVNVPSVSAINQSAPYGWNASNTVRASRPYGAAELYQYPDYPGAMGSRTMPVARPVRNFHEETPSVYPERFFTDGNVRYKPYPPVKEGYPQPRYECINNYPNPYHPPPYPPPRYDIQKSHNPHLYSAYSQVPVKYFENRITDPVIDGYQRSNPQPNYNVSYTNQFIHPAYGPVPGNCLQNKLLPYPSDMAIKPNPLNKLSYENKLFPDFENVRNKTFLPENYYGSKNQIMISKPHGSSIQNATSHPYYRKDFSPYRNYDPTKHADMATNIANPSLRFPSQFSPNVVGMSPLESNDPMHSLLLEDGNYVNHQPVTSMRFADQSLNTMNKIHPDMYARYDHKFSQLRRQMPNRTDTNNSSNSRDKKNIDVRQFLQQWNDDDDNNVPSISKQEVVPNATDAKLSTDQEQLYVLGLVNVPNEELDKYDHIQKISKLPDNIKGYNSLELLNQFEEAIECSNMNSKTATKPPDYHRNYKSMPIQRATVPPLQRPISPLDVEAKISQSVIHKEVGCNFEIKPCSPKMLNVEIATPVQTVLSERVIEKLSNPNVTKSPNNQSMMETLGFKNSRDQDFIVNNKKSSCKVNQNQFNTHNFTVPAKSNYSLSDLESSSGVCLASLPRLDNEIELNFPEVNQQFINANTKTDTVITATSSEIKSESTKLNESAPVSPEQSPPSIHTAQKLCKFRKSKKDECGINIETTNQVQAVRTDSVIIKNPDNIKEFGCSRDSPLLFTNLDLQDSENFKNGNVKDHNIALDFSLNKYSFDYDVNNKLEDDVYDSKNISSRNMCETSDNKQSLILETVSIEDIVPERSLSPETVKPETEKKIQDASFLVESSDLEPEQKGINKNNFAETVKPETETIIQDSTFLVKSSDLEPEQKYIYENNFASVLTNTDKDTGSTDDSNARFCEHQIVSPEHIKQEASDNLEKISFLEDSKLELKYINQNKIKPACDKVVDSSSRSQVQPKLLKEQYFTDIPDNLTESTNTSTVNLIDSRYFGSPAAQKALKTLEKNATISPINDLDQKIDSQWIESEHEQDTSAPLEEKEGNHIIKTILVSPNIAADHNTVSSILQNTLSSEDEDQEIILNEIPEYVTVEESMSVQTDSKKYDKNTVNQENNNMTKRLDDISLITGICFTTLSMEICNTEESKLNESVEFNKIDDSKQPTLSYLQCKENCLKDKKIQTKIDSRPDKCESFTIKNNINDSELCDNLDYHLNHKLTDHLEDDRKPFVHINKTETSSVTKQNFQTSPLKQNPFEKDTYMDCYGIEAGVNSIDFNEREKNTEFNVVNSPDKCSFTREKKHNIVHETSNNEPNLLNVVNYHELNSCFDLESENCNKTATKDCVKEKSYPSISDKNSKYFCVKLLSPQIYNLIINETGICKSILEIHDYKKKTAEEKYDSQTTSVVNEISKFDEVASCNINIEIKTVSKLDNCFSTFVETETCDSLNTLIDPRIHQKLIIDNLTSTTDVVEMQLYQVASLKNLVKKFLDKNCANIDLVSINKNSQNTEISSSEQNFDTTVIKNDAIFKSLRNTEVNVINKHNHEKTKRHLKRSLSESDLDNFENMGNSQPVHNVKRPKIITKKYLETESFAGNIFLHNNRRNSIATFLNEEDLSFCILIDDNCLITEECEDFDRNSTIVESECFEYVETELDIDNNCYEKTSCLSPVTNPKYLDSDILNDFNGHQSDEGTWIEDVACVETVVSDNVAEDIEVASESSPLDEPVSDYNSDGESSYTVKNNFNDHAEKVKHIYEGCRDNDHLMETLYRTPQMNVNKTLVKENQDVDNCIDQERADLENMLSESMTASTTTVSDVTTLARDSLIEARNLAPQTFNEEIPVVGEICDDNNSNIDSNLVEEKPQSATVHLCESSYENVFSDNEFTENTTQYSSSSSSPEVSSTTSEEKCSSILLKITSYNGSIVSEISNSREIKRISCKYTEKNDYNSPNSKRPLVTKAAQKYIPPIRETIQDLKVKLPLPQHSLLKLQQLKHSKQLKLENNTNNRFFPSRPDLPKKPKPKFEDVLKSIDEIQVKMHKEKKKIKRYIPKVVIKKNGNGSHYTSSSHDSFDPDLTGLKWQPWVFIERNGFIDKMASTRKTEAIYSHRKKEYVFRDKFHKYKSVNSAKFVITQPKLDDKGQLKYTIKLKHNY